ncbi:MAG: hypothetical protein A2885_20625 [Sphingopyxis sp. RIFCSPHIGHO2_01_FULL_65_24]|nr:MAG: hypothetical protein A2885_20625 [Sphingopyxis sp. RIFCSPHIGHO2_01_FULL_65_24]
MSNETELTISRLIKAPPSAVWDAWSDPAKLAAWWIPAPIECRVDKLDLRPGGGFVTRMREGDGAFQPHVDGCFLEAVPERRLVFTTVLTEGWQPTEPWLAITAILTFEAQDGGTLYAARVLHKTPEDSAKHDEMGFQEGWGTAIGQLAALIGR